jgi:CheY-like chemotaxis protein
MHVRLDASGNVFHSASRIAPSDLLGSPLRGSSDLFHQPSPRAGLSIFRGISKGKNRPRAAKSAREPRRTPAQILVVDDVPDVTEMLSLFLRRAGYEVATADSAAAALRLARSCAFDVVISDIGMPEMNGYELAGALRSLPNYNAIPMIAVTGYTEYDDRGRTLRSGFSAHLTKPIDPAGLLDLINDLLAR